MKYFIDSEFIERRGELRLISIAVVREDGQYFYGEASHVPWAVANDWVMEHVKPKLTGPQMDDAEIGRGIKLLIGDDPAPEFWGYYPAYDWVLFCWCFGTMMDLPAGWPKQCNDIRQMADHFGVTLAKKRCAEDAHHALVDARWARTLWQQLDVKGRAWAAMGKGDRS